MTPTVSIVAPGAMGAAIGARMRRHGAAVGTSLLGRSAHSARRAAEAGLVDRPDDELVDADVLMSIVPPGEAVALAERLAPALRDAARKPLYVDCNAVAPATVQRIAALIEATGTPFADASIIGPPPAGDDDGPTLYVAGGPAPRLVELERYGAAVRVLDGPVGAASALKMTYAGMTKGLIALGAAMVLAARGAGADAALVEELAASQPVLLAWLAAAMPHVGTRAYRWDRELDEVAAFLGDLPEAGMPAAAARLFARLAQEPAELEIVEAALRRGLSRQSASTRSSAAGSNHSHHVATRPSRTSKRPT